METIKNKPWSKTWWGLLLLICFLPFTFTYLIWKNKKWSKNMRTAIIVLMWLFFIIIGITNSDNNVGSSLNSHIGPTGIITNSAQKTTNPTKILLTNTPEPSPTSIPLDINGFPIDSEAVTVNNLCKAPSTYTGKKVTFTCKVIGFAKDNSGNASAVNCSDVDDYTSIIQVDTILFDMTRINKNDIVRFFGRVSGVATGKNAFGSDVTETIVSGEGINDLTSGYKE